MARGFIILLVMIFVPLSRTVQASEKFDIATIIRDAEQGNANAQYNLGVIYDGGKGVSRDGKQAVNWYRKAAEQGVGQAQFNLGVMYDIGDGVTRNDKQAVYWYRKAAEQGDAEAQYNLGVKYWGGKGVAQDDVNAYVWYELAAAQGDNDAAMNRDSIASKLTLEQQKKGQKLISEIRAKINNKTPWNPSTLQLQP